MTQGDRIRKANDDELTNELNYMIGNCCSNCPVYDDNICNGEAGDCTEKIAEWLQSEVK